MDCGLVAGAVSFLVAGFFRVWLHCRQFFERVHLPDAAGHERIRALYQHAIASEYRFFSYGDAMLLARDESKSTVAAG